MNRSNPSGPAYNTTNESIEKFKAAMLQAGLQINDEIIANGAIHRFKQPKDSGTPCWYILHADGIAAGRFGCFKRAIDESWCSKDPSSLSPAEQQQSQQRAASRKLKIEAEKQLSQKTAALECQRILLETKEPNPTHPYLKKKKIQPTAGLKQLKENLIIPIRDDTGMIVNLQFISPDGSKRFKSCARKKGCFHIIGSPGKCIWIVEGYATGVSVYLATNETVVVAFDAGNLMPVTKNIKNCYPSSHIIIAGDNDHIKERNIGHDKAKEAANLIGCSYIIPQFSKDSIGTDFNDIMLEAGIEEVKNQLSINNEANLKSYAMHDFLSLNLKPRENIIDPWLPTQGLVMVYAPRGVGKTYFALTLAISIASGSACFSWKVPKPRGVLYLDGEMPNITMQDRLKKLTTNRQIKPNAPLTLITRDSNPCKHFCISDLEGQREIEKHLEGIDLIVVDNISTLCPVKENDADAWTPIQEWALQMRARGISVLFIHHANKSGTARGTSRREDILDTVISLRRPSGYSQNEGAVFEVHFEKSRGFNGSDADPIQLTLDEKNEGLEWKTETVEQTTYEKVIALSENGLNQKDIAEELSIHKSNVSRHIKTAKNNGRLS